MRTEWSFQRITYINGVQYLDLFSDLLSPLTALAVLIQQVGESELKVYIVLLRQMELGGCSSVRMSLSQIVKMTEVSRRSVQLAIESLSEKHLLTVEPGTPTQAAAYTGPSAKFTPRRQAMTSKWTLQQIATIRKLGSL